ncbi:MAG TPA: RIO1 family regulatory kinase/ATPase [Anaeromyxobacter sp.]|nr:RIO1 family regulatory kinase/ATPase [Anaeromyxobacter sp.]
MNDPLAPLLADGVVEEVCARLKSGKEADLWLVRHGGEIVAAKVYKAREARSFRNNAGYREGRQVRDTRTQRAMDRGSRFGHAAAEEAWKAKEADALYALHAAGVRVPKPVMFYEGVLLMELVVDAHGHPAPRLVDASVAREQAAALYADLRGQMVRMLSCDLIHGDLSPYNVLVGWNGPVVIDFPQVVGAAHNSQAESFFHRDLENLRRFFAGLDPALGAAVNDGREIWRAYVRRELSPEFVPTGRTVEPPRRSGDGGRGHAQGRAHGQEHADHHHPRPHEGAAGRDRGRPDRRDRPATAAPREAREAARAGSHAGSGQPGPHQPGPRQPGPRQSGPRQPGPRQPGPQPGPRQSGPRQPGPQSGPRQSGSRQPGPQSGPRQPGPQPGPRQPRPPGRGPDGRRAAPAPEVIRVVRPPLGPRGTTAPSVPQSAPQGAAPGGQRAPGPRAHDSQRRRRD